MKIEKAEKEDSCPNADLSIWYRYCQKEVEIPLEGNITFGSVPYWLNGSLIRNGPGGVDAYGQGSYNHLFDAPGFLQKFEISNGTVRYSNRFMRTNSFHRNTLAQRLDLSEFGTVAVPDPCQTIFQRIAAVFLEPVGATLTDNANIGIHPFGDELYSLGETPFAHRIDLNNLQTLETIDVNKECGIINHSSHPHVIGRKVYNIGQKLKWNGPHYIIAEMNCADEPNKIEKPSYPVNNSSPWSTAEIVAEIPSRWPLSVCYMHSFALTPNFFIVIEQPMGIFIPSVPISQVFRNGTLSSCLKFYPEEDTIFHIVPRFNKANKKETRFWKKGQNCQKRRTFRAPSFFFLHTINAFEEIEKKNNNTDAIDRDATPGDSVTIVVDICCYKDPSMIECMYIDALKDAHSNPNYATKLRGRPKRFRMKLSDFDKHSSLGIMPIAESHEIVDIGCELPRINYDNFNGQPYKYFYAMSSDVDLDNPGMLVKVDVQNKSYKTWCEPQGYPSEPIFVPQPNGSNTDEDNGIILSSVVYGKENVSGPNKTSLIILNAKTWELISKVEIHCESAIPKCLHGWYFPSTPKDNSKPENESEITRKFTPVAESNICNFSLI